MKKQLIALAALAALTLFFGGGQALAAASGQAVSNTAQLTYNIGVDPQPPVDSNTVTTTIDKKIDLLVTRVGAATIKVVPGSAIEYALPFLVTNEGNDPQDIDLESLVQTGVANPFGGPLTDTFDGTFVKVVADNDGDNTYDGDDTLAYIDELAGGASKQAYIVITVPYEEPVGTPLITNDLSVYALRATARVGGALGVQGAALPAQAVIPTAGVDLVYADDAGSDDTVGVRDAQHSARSAYQVLTMEVAKSQAITDEFGTSYSIPGATVAYSLSITNHRTVNADNVVLTDPIPVNTQYVAGSLVCSTGTPYWNNGAWVAAEPAAASVTQVRCDFGTVAPAATETATFSVIIQ